MNELILYCKSYNKDVQRAKILLNSIDEFNKDRIPFYISVPTEDVQLFKNILGNPIGNIETLGRYERYKLITDEEIIGEKLVQDWKTQQIIKSSFWKLGLSFNNLMIDSDSYFIKPFYIKDFIVDEENHIPYTVMHEQKDLFSWTSKNVDILGFDPQKSFVETRTPIMEIFDRKGKIFDGGPGPMIFCAKVWKSLEDEYLKPNGLTFQNLIETMPSEFSWYLEWILSKKIRDEEIIPLWPIEPIFKFFHYKEEYLDFKQQGYTLGHWSKNYFGITMQSSSGLPLVY